MDRCKAEREWLLCIIQITKQTDKTNVRTEPTTNTTHHRGGEKWWSKFALPTLTKPTDMGKLPTIRDVIAYFFSCLARSIPSLIHHSTDVRKGKLRQTVPYIGGIGTCCCFRKSVEEKNDDCPVGSNGTNRGLGGKQSEEIMWVDVFGLCSKPSCTSWDLLFCIFFFFWYCSRKAIVVLTEWLNNFVFNYWYRLRCSFNYFQSTDLRHLRGRNSKTLSVHTQLLFPPKSDDLTSSKLITAL